MASPMDLTTRIHIVLEMDRPGPEMQQLGDQIQTVQVRVAEMNQIQNTYRSTTVSTTASVRHLLLNLRMFSFGIRTLRREFGDTNPALEAFSTGLITIAAIGSSVVSAMSLVRGAVGRLAPYLAGMNFSTIIGSSKILIGLLGGPAGVAAGLLALVAVPVAGWAMEATSGISSLRREVKGMEGDLKMLEAQLKTLTDEQDKYNLSVSATQIQLRLLKRAIDLTGPGNESLEAQYAALTAELENMSIATMEATLRQKELQVAETDLKTVQEDKLRMAQAIKMSRIRGAPSADVIYEAMKSESTTGRPSLSAMQTAGRERGPAGLGAGGAPQVTINFPGATFNTEADIEAALEAGGSKAARILYNQYMIPGAQR